MVVPLFGWSAGDIVVSVQIIYRVGKAFREAGGAKEQYAETAAWLDSFAHDLERIVEHVTDNPSAKYTDNIKEQIAHIDRHYAHFEKYVRKQDAALSSTSSVNVVKQAFVKVRWAIKELKGYVDTLKSAVGGPLISINLLLSLQHQHALHQVSQELASLTQSSSVNTVEQTVQDIATQLQRTELGLADLQSSVGNQTTTLQCLRTALQDDISAECRSLLEAQESMLLATLTAIRGSRHSALDDLDSLGQRLDELDQRIGDSSTDLKDMLDDQRVGIQACQLHLENIEDAIQHICQVSNQQAARDWSNEWLQALQTTGIIVGALAGVSNMLTIRTLKGKLEIPAGKKPSVQSFTPSPLMKRYLAESKREGSFTTISSQKRQPGASDPDEFDRFTTAWHDATKKWQSHVCYAGPYLSKERTVCTGMLSHDRQCRHILCEECKKDDNNLVPCSELRFFA